jgi:hypothetical protein
MKILETLIVNKFNYYGKYNGGNQGPLLTLASGGDKSGKT